MSFAITLTGIALASLAAAGLLTVVAVGIAELFGRKKEATETLTVSNATLARVAGEWQSASAEWQATANAWRDQFASATNLTALAEARARADALKDWLAEQRDRAAQTNIVNVVVQPGEK